jgi:hypothetical protein
MELLCDAFQAVGELSTLGIHLLEALAKLMLVALQLGMLVLELLCPELEAMESPLSFRIEGTHLRWVSFVQALPEEAQVMFEALVFSGYGSNTSSQLLQLPLTSQPWGICRAIAPPEDATAVEERTIGRDDCIGMSIPQNGFAESEVLYKQHPTEHREQHSGELPRHRNKLPQPSPNPGAFRHRWQLHFCQPLICCKNRP